MRKGLAAAIFLAPAVACAQDCPLRDLAFEFAVPPVDLKTFPTVAEASPGASRRASMANDMLRVLGFDGEGAECLLRLVRVDADDFDVVSE